MYTHKLKSNTVIFPDIEDNVHTLFIGQGKSSSRLKTQCLHVFKYTYKKVGLAFNDVDYLSWDIQDFKKLIKHLIVKHNLQSVIICGNTFRTLLINPTLCKEALSDIHEKGFYLNIKEFKLPAFPMYSPVDLVLENIDWNPNKLNSTEIKMLKVIEKVISNSKEQLLKGFLDLPF